MFYLISNFSFYFSLICKLSNSFLLQRELLKFPFDQFSKNNSHKNNNEKIQPQIFTDIFLCAFLFFLFDFLPDFMCIFLYIFFEYGCGPLYVTRLQILRAYINSHQCKIFIYFLRIIRQGKIIIKQSTNSIAVQTQYTIKLKR